MADEGQSAETRPHGLGRLLADGHDPDPRFTLANERTFLAWVRTALALLAGGVGVEAFAVAVPGDLRRVLAAVLVLLGGVLAASSFVRWLAVERAMRQSRPLPVPTLVPVLAAGLAAVAVVLLVVVLTRG